MDGGAWWAAVHGVAKSQTRLSDFTFTFHFPALEKEMVGDLISLGYLKTNCLSDTLIASTIYFSHSSLTWVIKLYSTYSLGVKKSHILLFACSWITPLCFVTLYRWWCRLYIHILHHKTRCAYLKPFWHQSNGLMLLSYLLFDIR